MLDEAGYKDVDGDGLRENKDGSKLTINFAARTRDEANESLVQQYLNWWKEIGLDVKLYTGRTIELNSFYDKVQADDPEIDVFAGGWSTGYDPNPEGLFGESANSTLNVMWMLKELPSWIKLVQQKHSIQLKILSSIKNGKNTFTIKHLSSQR